VNRERGAGFAGEILVGDKRGEFGPRGKLHRRWAVPFGRIGNEHPHGGDLPITVERGNSTVPIVITIASP